MGEMETGLFCGEGSLTPPRKALLLPFLSHRACALSAGKRAGSRLFSQSAVFQAALPPRGPASLPLLAWAPARGQLEGRLG